MSLQWANVSSPPRPPEPLSISREGRAPRALSCFPWAGRAGILAPKSSAEAQCITSRSRRTPKGVRAFGAPFPRSPLTSGVRPHCVVSPCVLTVSSASSSVLPSVVSAHSSCRGLGLRRYQASSRSITVTRGQTPRLQRSFSTTLRSRLCPFSLVHWFPSSSQSRIRTGPAALLVSSAGLSTSLKSEGLSECFQVNIRCGTNSHPHISRPVC